MCRVTVRLPNQDSCSLQELTGETVDISEDLDFGFTKTTPDRVRRASKDGLVSPTTLASYVLLDYRATRHGVGVTDGCVELRH
jgi:hypothetical protein